MHFEYQISADEYVAAQELHHKLSCGRAHNSRAITWILCGVFFVVVAWNEQVLNWATGLLAYAGAYSVYAGIAGLLPRRYFRRAYPAQKFEGKKYWAEVNEEGFEVAEEYCEWRVRWPAVRLKGENNEVFMLATGGTIFIFGKKYLTSEQQGELRSLLAKADSGS